MEGHTRTIASGRQGRNLRSTDRVNANRNLSDDRNMKMEEIYEVLYEVIHNNYIEHLKGFTKKYKIPNWVIASGGLCLCFR